MKIFTKRCCIIFVQAVFLFSTYNLSAQTKDGLYAQIQTNKGNILVELAYKTRPLAVANFIGLAEGTIANKVKPLGKPYYDGMIFFKKYRDSYIMGGDPLNNGMGGPGYFFNNEFDSSITNSGGMIMGYSNQTGNTNGSIFYLAKNGNAKWNDHFTAFGWIREGFWIIDSLQANDTIRKVKILRVGPEVANYTVNTDTFKVRQAAQVKAEFDRFLRDKDEFEAWVKTRDTAAVILPSGLMIHIENPGVGDSIRFGQQLTLAYIGFMQDGTLFDKSGDNWAPRDMHFVEHNLIKGWEEGMRMLREGGIATFYIPYRLGFGIGGVKERIPGRTNLIIRVQVFEAKDYEKKSD